MVWYCTVGIAVFVDRAGNFFRPPGAEAIAAGLKVGTVLDGEIVFNLHFRKQLFLVFDVLCNEGQPCAHLPFGERTALIASSIMTKCGHIDYKAAERPLWIIRKKFYPKKDLKQLLRFMVRVIEGGGSCLVVVPGQLSLCTQSHILISYSYTYTHTHRCPTRAAASTRSPSGDITSQTDSSSSPMHLTCSVPMWTW